MTIVFQLQGLHSALVVVLAEHKYPLPLVLALSILTMDRVLHSMGQIRVSNLIDLLCDEQSC